MKRQELFGFEQTAQKSRRKPGRKGILKTQVSQERSRGFLPFSINHQLIHGPLMERNGSLRPGLFAQRLRSS
jgi:hypothetical protein